MIGGEHFFVRARLVLSVLDADQEFDWAIAEQLLHPDARPH